MSEKNKLKLIKVVSVEPVGEDTHAFHLIYKSKPFVIYRGFTNGSYTINLERVQATTPAFKRKIIEMLGGYDESLTNKRFMQEIGHILSTYEANPNAIAPYRPDELMHLLAQRNHPQFNQF